MAFFLIKQVSLTYLKTLGLKIAKLKVAESDPWAPSLTALCTLYLLHISISVTSKTVVSHETTAVWSNLSIFASFVFETQHWYLYSWAHWSLVSDKTSTTLPHASGDPLQSSWFPNGNLAFTVRSSEVLSESRPRTVCFKLCMFC